jgi:hypothetical protein
MAYEEFQRLTTRVDDPTVSITPDGRFVLNAAASRLLSAAGIKDVKLLWDRSRSKIAFKATSKGDNNGYSVSFSGHSAGVRAKSFLVHIGWAATRRLRLMAAWDPKNEMLEVSLPKQDAGWRRIV